MQFVICHFLIYLFFLSHLVSNPADTSTLKIRFNEINKELLSSLVLARINQERKKKDLDNLVWDDTLHLAAINHTDDMVRLKFVSHLSPIPAKKTPKDRVKQALKKGKAKTDRYNKKILFIKENIIKTFSIKYETGSWVDILTDEPLSKRYIDKNGNLIEPHSYKSFTEQVIKQWMNSPSHKETILSKNSTHTGIGLAIILDEMPYIIVTQLFAHIIEIP